MIKAYKNSLTEPKLKRIKQFEPKSWVSVIKPDESELKHISKKLKVPYDVLQDSIDPYELPRIAVENESLIIIVRAPLPIDDSFITLPLTLIFNSEYLLTVVPQSIPTIEMFMDQRIDFYTTQQSNFIIKMAMTVIEQYQRYTNKLIRAIQRTKSRLDDIKREDIYTFIETEETLNGFVASLTPTIVVLKKLLGGSYLTLYQEDKELIDDLLVDAEQVLDLCLTSLKTIKNIRNGYETVLSMRLNSRISLLTYVTTFFTIPMVIASIYGMNIKLPFAGHPYAFIFVMLLTFVLCIGLITIFAIFRKRL